MEKIAIVWGLMAISVFYMTNNEWLPAIYFLLCCIAAQLIIRLDEVINLLQRSK